MLDPDMDFHRNNFDVHRGRTASYPTAPSHPPACGITAPGSSKLFAYVLCTKLNNANVVQISAIPRSEVCVNAPALHVRLTFPLQATQLCSPLPHVIGPTVSEYYE